MRRASLVLCLLVGPVAAQEAGSATAPVIEPPASAPPAPIAPPVVEPPASAPPAAIAPQTPGPPGRPVTTAGAKGEQHEHLGLFVHIDLGVGYLRTTGSKGGSTFTTEGAALGIGLAVGWAPNDEWALGLEFWNWRSLSASGLGSNTSVELQALGVNITRNFVPADVFATIVVSGTRLVITDGGDYEYASSDIGFGFKALLGKEWHVSSWVRLGVAGEVFLSVNRDSGQTLRTLGGGLLFSCTGL